jgi:methionyl aminopeptidase
MGSKISIKSEEEIIIMSEAGHKLARVLKILAGETKAGVNLMDLESLSRKLINSEGAKPAFLNYRPEGALKAYPFSLCASINSVIVHGQPSDYKIKEGDLVKLDLGLVYKNFYSDAALTVAVGKVSPLAMKLVEATRKALSEAIYQARPGKTLGDIGWAIEKTAKENGFSVADGLTGHGIGRALHEEPAVYNFGSPRSGLKLAAGMVLAIEPMLVAGKGRIKELEDESYATADGSLSAHFEHTIVVAKTGPIILTK